MGASTQMNVHAADAPAAEGTVRVACDPYAALKIENQICFPLYAVSKEIVRRYKPLLDELDLTYTQYIAMMVLWDAREVNVSELGARLYLDSGTLTPLLKKLEDKGYVTRHRAERDRRELRVSVTERGMALRDRALAVPRAMAGCVHIDAKDASELYRLLYKVLDNMDS